MIISYIISLILILISYYIKNNITVYDSRDINRLTGKIINPEKVNLLSYQ